MLRYRWRETERNWFPRPEAMNPTLHALLIQRGIGSAEAAEQFLHPQASHLEDPMRLHDMDRAVARIRRALDQRQLICVYGDYDVDGVSASSLLSDYLRGCGGEVEVYLPSRHTEGYGLNETAIRGIAARASLMVTVDCGVTSVELVALAQSLGLDCVVTDHHQIAETLPDCPVVNPLLGDYPYPSLCGAGVAFKLVQALGGLDAAMEYVDIAALATVADVVPLTGENRVIVSLGLERINAAPRPGLKALIEVSGLADKRINAGNIAFQLAPRLNAGGRIGSARRSYDLLLSPDVLSARPVAEELEGENRARKEIEQRILAEAEAQLEDFDFPAHRALVLAGQGWNPGVIGLTASRLVEKYHYPVILLSESDGTLTGSCRSIPGVDIHAALTGVQHRLIRYGGHRQAAGLTLESAELDGFRRDLDAWLFENVSPTCYIPEQEYDMEVSFDELTESFVGALDALQPTGFGNPAPVFRAQARVVEQRAVGLEGAHLKLTLSESSIHRGGIYFRAGALAGRLPERVDALFSPKINVFMGRSEVQLELKAIKSGDVLSEISAKVKDEDEVQQEFLTEMLYNKIIDLFQPEAQPLSMAGLSEMFQSGPQGTLILTADLTEAARLSSALEAFAPDVWIRSVPDDPRAFNAICAYPPAKLPGGYRRIVLAGVPAVAEVPEGTVFYRMDARTPWLDELPDVDALREVYKAVRELLRRPVRCDTFPMLAHLLSSATGSSFLCCAACALALHDMDLIRLKLDGPTIQLTLNPMRKTDPESSAVWRALQAWREMARARE